MLKRTEDGKIVCENSAGEWDPYAEQSRKAILDLYGVPVHMLYADLRDRFTHDAKFHELTRHLVDLLRATQMTPDDLREAASMMELMEAEHNRSMCDHQFIDATTRMDVGVRCVKVCVKCKLEMTVPQPTPEQREAMRRDWEKINHEAGEVSLLGPDTIFGPGVIDKIKNSIGFALAADGQSVRVGPRPEQGEAAASEAVERHILYDKDGKVVCTLPNNSGSRISGTYGKWPRESNPEKARQLKAKFSGAMVQRKTDGHIMKVCDIADCRIVCYVQSGLQDFAPDELEVWVPLPATEVPFRPATSAQNAVIDAVQLKRMSFECGEAHHAELTLTCCACGCASGEPHAPECPVLAANIARHAQRPDLFAADGSAILPNPACSFCGSREAVDYLHGDPPPEWICEACQNRPISDLLAMSELPEPTIIPAAPNGP